MGSEIHDKEIFDLIIIGGGINGSGIAREAAERGLKVFLLEKEDYASGCSAHSTRLIHGGLRYLEYFEFSLVFESLQEREILLENFPNLIEPIELHIPCFKTNKHGFFKLNLGMMLYDLLSWGKSLKSYWIKRGKKPDGTKVPTIVYYDCQIPLVERLCLENILSAKRHGAICKNHSKVTEIIHKDGIALGVKYIDSDKQEQKIFGRNVINVSGPWVDLVNKRALDYPSKRIGGTKGSHIVLKPFKGAPHQYGIYTEARKDGRPFFVLPIHFASNQELILVGTTDIFAKENEIEEPKISGEEEYYLLNEINRLFPDARLGRDDIVKTFSGIRPLPGVISKKTGAITRRHFIIHHASEGLSHYFSVIGGKITTYRSLAEELVTKFTDNKSFSKTNLSLSSNFKQHAHEKTNRLAYKAYLKSRTGIYSENYSIEAATVEHLIKIYGTRAHEVLDLCIEKPELKNKIHKDYMDIEAQILYAIQFEDAKEVDDILERRLTLGLCMETIPEDVIDKVKGYLENAINNR